MRTLLIAFGFTAFALPKFAPIAKEIGRYRCGQIDYVVALKRDDIYRHVIIHQGCMTNPDSLWIEWADSAQAKP